MPEPGEQEQLITYDGPSVEDGRPREVTVTQDSERGRTSEEGQIARSVSNGVASGDTIDWRCTQIMLSRQCCNGCAL
jgi:hypothetical protein